MTELPSQPNKTLKESLYERIETEKVCPRSRLFFRGRECVVWAAWFVSVVVGALAVAISLFVVTHRQYELYEATHENFLTFMVEVLPFLWLVTFLVMVYIAVYNLRHTKRGYRYPVWMIVVSSVVLSFAGGSALQLFGFGYTIDNILGENMDMYMSQTKLERKMWQMPEEGRLLGKQVYVTLATTSVVVFEDIDGRRWNMDISELTGHDMELLSGSQEVRVLGEAVYPELYIFHACAAFPWMINSEVTMSDMSRERQAFIEKLYSHIEKAEEHLTQMESYVFSSTPIPETSVCARIAAVQRIPMVKN